MKTSYLFKRVTAVVAVMIFASLPVLPAARAESLPLNTTQHLYVPCGNDPASGSYCLNNVPPYMPGEIILKFKEAAQPTQVLSNLQLSVNTVKEMAPVIRKLNLAAGDSGGLDRIYKMSLADPGQMSATLEKLKNNPNVEYAQPNYTYMLFFTPNDEDYHLQWAHPASYAEEGWDIEQGNSDTVIAIVDSGVDYTHPDLENNIWEDESGHPGYNAVDNNYDPMDIHYHGTHCAGIAAAEANNDIGVAGACPDCLIMPVRAGIPYGDQVYFTTQTIVAAIHWAVDNGADVISMSFGGYGGDWAQRDAMNYAHSYDVVLVAAAGNDNTDMPSYPAAFDHVIAVAAINEGLNRTNYGEDGWGSNYGSWVDVAAPGAKIHSTIPTRYSSPYGDLSGTSMACPYVAGVAGLIRSHYPDLNADQVGDVVTGYVQDLDSPMIGGGVHVYSALTNGDVPPEPRPTPEPPGPTPTPPGPTPTPPPDPDPVAIISSPADNAVITENFDIAGTAQGDAYELSYGVGVDPENWFPIAMANYPVTGLLGQVDITHFPEGPYTLRLVVEKGALSAEDTNIIYISKSMHEGWPKDLDPTGIHSFTPALVDLDQDDDGLKEIVIAASEKQFAFSHDGIDVPGWPILQPPPLVEANGQLPGAALHDLDNDGILDIVINGQDTFDAEPDAELQYSFNVYQPDGTFKAGWPLKARADMEHYSAYDINPVIEDLDNDGQYEIVNAAYTDHFPDSEGMLTLHSMDIHVFNADATEAEGWPVTLPTSVELGGHKIMAVADIDHDQDKEIIFVARYRDPQAEETEPWQYSLYIYHHDGTPVEGYPLRLPLLDGTNTGGGIQVVDIDKDGEPELGLFLEQGTCSENEGQFLYINLDGTYVAGWPVAFNGQASPGVPPALGDLDNDGRLEVIFGTIGGCAGVYNNVYAFNDDGTLKAGWPVPMLDEQEGVWSQVSIDDVNGDGFPDVVAASDLGRIYAWDKDGQLLEGFPKMSGERIVSGVAIDDIDGDDLIELVAVTNDGKAFVWDLDSPYDGTTMDWPMFQHDLRRTGLVDLEPPTTPLNLTATVTAVTVSLNWEPSTDDIGVVGYKIFRDGELAGTSPTVSYIDKHLEPLTTYQYQVLAYDAVGHESALSESVDIMTEEWIEVPDVVTGLVAEPGNGQVTLRWDLLEDELGIIGYQIDYGIGHAERFIKYVKNPDADGNKIRSAVIKGLTNETEYWFKVRAYNSNGPGPASLPLVYATPRPDAVPSQITDLTATPGVEDVTLRWTVPDLGVGIIGYQIDYGLATGERFIQYLKAGDETQINVRTLTIEKLTGGASYWFRIRAYNDKGPGQVSQAVSATPVTK